MTQASIMLNTAIEEARAGLAEGGIPIGAALYNQSGVLLGKGRNRRVQNDDPSAHAETEAFRNAGRQSDYSQTVMVTTLAPCWYCSGLIRQFGIPRVVVGESANFSGGVEWLASAGVSIEELADSECISMLASFIDKHPDLWNEDIGRSKP